MSERVDAEIKRLLDSGQTPIRINVGIGLCRDMQAEQNSKLGLHTPLSEYEGYPVICVESVEPNYLNIEAMTITSAEE
jgi:hypothetical protein